MSPAHHVLSTGTVPPRLISERKVEAVVPNSMLALDDALRKPETAFALAMRYRNRERRAFDLRYTDAGPHK
jgi:hypothetical protein